MEPSSSPRINPFAAGTSGAASQDTTTNWVLLGTLYLCEFLGLVTILSLYTLGRKSSFFTFLSSRPGFLFVAGVLGAALSSLALARQYRQWRQARSRTFGLTVAMNIVTILMLFSLGEGVVRVSYKHTPTGDVWGDTYLLPREWTKVVDHYTDYFRSTLGNPTYHIFDDVLGWTVGRNRRSEGGLYFSSAEGIRSPLTGMAFADQSATVRIALVGDSYTFAQEVSFEESWGYQLERQLGRDFQVLNFGVMGYGIGQAYLRYVQDVRSWHPDVVVFGVINDDLVRAMGIYSFLHYAEAKTPFPKPRFVVRDQQLVLLNTPLISPERILAAKSIRDLPYIEYDREYIQGEWDRPYWFFPSRSYLFRWLASWLPLWENPREQNSYESMRTIAREIFRSFAQRVRADGAIPILAYMPDEFDFSEEARQYQPNFVPIGIKVLQEAGLAYTDLTPCLSKIPARDRRVKGEALRHFSPQSNGAIASCLRKVVVEQLQTQKHTSSYTPRS